MKKQIITIIGMIFLLAMISNVQSEEYLYNTVSLYPDESIVNLHLFYWFDDTSVSGIGMNKDIPITLYYVVQDLPYNLTYGNVDWCNFTIIHYQNIYGALSLIYGGGLAFLNQTTEIQSFYFDSSLTSGIVKINARSRDIIQADMKCHYTNVSDLYENNILVGRFTTYMPSFECSTCTQYDFEQLTNRIDTADNITQNELIIYNKIQTVVNWDFQIWLILSWIIKIVFLLIAVGLIFSGVFYFYQFLQKISEEI